MNYRRLMVLLSVALLIAAIYCLTGNFLPVYSGTQLPDRNIF